MTYDESLAKAEAIIQQLENSDAISIEEYKRLAAEATTLLKQCKAYLMLNMEEMQLPST